MENRKESTISPPFDFRPFDEIDDGSDVKVPNQFLNGPSTFPDDGFFTQKKSSFYNKGSLNFLALDLTAIE